VPAVADALIPGMAPIRLPRLIGLGPARRLMLSGAEIGSEEAARLGLVDHVIPDDDRDAAITQMLQPYLAAPTAVAGLKQLLASAFAPPVATLAPPLPACSPTAWRQPNWPRPTRIGTTAPHTGSNKPCEAWSKLLGTTGVATAIERTLPTRVRGRATRRLTFRRHRLEDAH
jgi:hypothetical protein